MENNIYKFDLLDAKGHQYSLKQHMNKVILIVNTASKCGYTKQYAELEKLYQDYKDQGLVIIAVPTGQFLNQEFSTDEKIQNFCRVKYNISFDILKKTKVNGNDAEPLFKYLKKEIPGEKGEAIEWNFAKFLVDKNGNVVKRYLPKTSPSELKDDIEALL